MVKTGRNEECPCGSGKKYKHCCLNIENRPMPDFENNRLTSPTPNVLTNLEDAKVLLMQEMNYKSKEEFDADFKRYEDFMGANLNENESLSFKEFMDGKSPTQEFTNAMQDAIKNLNLQTEEEMKDFSNLYVKNYNDSPQEDFLGLSPNEMRTLMEYTDELDYYIENKNPLLNIKTKDIKANVSNIRLIKILKLVINEYIKDDGRIKITQTGNFSLKLMNKIRKEIFNESDDHIKEIRLIESDIWPISMVHWILKCNDFVNESTSASNFRIACLHFLENSKKDLDHALWLLSFKTLMFDTSWVSMSIFSEEFDEKIAFFQHVKMFCFYILHELDSKNKGAWIKTSELLKIFKKAYPTILKDDDTKFFTSGDLFLAIFIHQLCDSLGLIEHNKANDTDDELNLDDNYEEIRCTDLFREVFNWKI